MKRWLVALALLACPLLSRAATPGLIQFASCGGNNADAIGISAGGVMNCAYSHPVLSGNFLVAVFNYSEHAQTVSIADDKSQSWTKGACVENATDTQWECVYYFPNSASGVVVVQLTSTGASTGFVKMSIGEYVNVATSSPLDVACATNTGASTSITSGSMTTVTAGDLIVQGAANTQNNVTSFTVGSSPWKMLDADVFDLQATQYQIQASAGAINSTLTQAPSGRFASVACAFKSAAAGTVLPGGLRVIRRLDNNTNQETSGTNAFQTPMDTGNLIVLLYSSSFGYNISSIADTSSNTYTQVCNISNTTVHAEIWYAKAVTTAYGLKITTTMSGTSPSGHGVTFQAFEVAGASTTPLDTGYGTSGCASATGNQPTGGAGGNVTTFSAAPTNANELTVAVGSIDKDTANGWAAPTGAIFTATFYTGEPEPSFADENNPFGVFLDSSTTSKTWTFTHDTSEFPGIGNWANMGASFMAPAVANKPPSQSIIFGAAGVN